MDQASNLRNLVKRHHEEVQESVRARVITVTSGKGGVGKSNVSVNLAIQLKKLGKKVVIFDADFGLANVEVIFGIVPKYTLADVIYNNMNILDILTEGPMGTEFISGGSGIKELRDLDYDKINFLVEKLAELDNYADVIIIDTGAGISESVLRFVYASNEIILVTTPEPTSVTDAYAILKAIRNNTMYDETKKINILVNRVSGDKEGVDIYQKLNKVTQKFLEMDLDNLGFLPEDRLVPKAVVEQTPVSIIYPKSDIAKAFEKLGENVASKKPYDEQRSSYGLSHIFSTIFGQRGGR